MNEITVEELCDQLHELIKNGHGKDIVLLSDDDEMNGMHTCFTGGSVINGKDYIDMSHDLLKNTSYVLIY